MPTHKQTRHRQDTPANRHASTDRHKKADTQASGYTHEINNTTQHNTTPHHTTQHRTIHHLTWAWAHEHRTIHHLTWANPSPHQRQTLQRAEAFTCIQSENRLTPPYTGNTHNTFLQDDTPTALHVQGMRPLQDGTSTKWHHHIGSHLCKMTQLIHDTSTATTTTLATTISTYYIPSTRHHKYILV